MANGCSCFSGVLAFDVPIKMSRSRYFFVCVVCAFASRTHFNMIMGFFLFFFPRIRFYFPRDGFFEWKIENCNTNLMLRRKRNWTTPKCFTYYVDAAAAITRGLSFCLFRYFCFHSSFRRGENEKMMHATIFRSIFRRFFEPNTQFYLTCNMHRLEHAVEKYINRKTNEMCARLMWNVNPSVLTRIE